jgi:curved DNA-binding protein CbpA
MPIHRSHYQRLRVAEQATAQDIQAAWQAAVARQQRVAGESPIAQAVALADIHAAYEVLSDPQRRAHYDQQLMGRRGPPPKSVVPSGWAPQSANDEHAGPPPRSPPAAWERCRTQLRRVADWLQAVPARLAPHATRQRGWAVGMAAAAVLGGWWVTQVVDGVEARAARPLPPQAAEAYPQWLAAASRATPHPLDGEPLRLKR